MFWDFYTFTVEESLNIVVRLYLAKIAAFAAGKKFEEGERKFFGSSNQQVSGEMKKLETLIDAD